MSIHLPQIETIAREQLDAFVASRDKVVLLLGTEGQAGFLRDVRHHFARKYEGAVRFGYCDSSEVYLLRLVRGIFNGPVPPAEAPAGYYLFASGQAVAFHPGTTVGGETDLKILGVGALVSLFAWSSKPLTATMSALEGKAAKGVVAFFEDMISKLPPPIDWSRFAASLRTKIELPDPFGVLGIRSSATENELTNAFRAQVRLNHPDLVANMSKEIQALAHERTKAINAAYAAIKKGRKQR